MKIIETYKIDISVGQIIGQEALGEYDIRLLGSMAVGMAIADKNGHLARGGHFLNTLAFAIGAIRASVLIVIDKFGVDSPMLENSRRR